MKKVKFIISLIATTMCFNCVFSQTNDILTPPVGIGTSTPVADLHIHSNVLHEYNPGFEPEDGNRYADGYYLTTFRMTNTTSGSGAQDGFHIELYEKDVTLQQKESARIKIFAKNDMGIIIDSAGRIGLGTNPVSNRRLIASGQVGFTGNVYCSNDINVSQCINTNNLSATGNVTISGNTTIGNGFYCSYNGQVKAKEIIVTLQGWSDYVFDRDYKLMPLGELERYINANKHLPNIPSAEQVENGGVNIGEMNALLLEKIEELTLYIIDLQKQIDELKQQKK